MKPFNPFTAPKKPLVNNFELANKTISEFPKITANKQVLEPIQADKKV